MQTAERLFLGALALLVCDTAAGFASGLAGSLALAAAAVLSAVAKIAGLKSLDVFHNSNLRYKFKNFHRVIITFYLTVVNNTPNIL